MAVVVHSLSLQQSYSGISENIVHKVTTKEISLLSAHPERT